MPHTLIPSHGSPGPSQQFQTAPGRRLLIKSGSKKAAQINLIRDAPFPEPPFFCLSKSPGKRTPSSFPNGGPYGESCPFPEPSFTCFLNSSIKFLVIKRYFTLLSKTLRKERPSVFPETSPLWKQTSISRALLGISYGVPSKGALPPGSPHRVHTETDAPFPEPFFIHLSKSPVYESPSRFPSGAPMETDACLLKMV